MVDKLDTETRDMLITLAIIAQGNSYSPHSNYPVGAAVLAMSPIGMQQVFVGTNIENDSYGLTICAERVAIFSAVSSGFTRLLAMACVTETGEGTSCGACRQVEYQFAPDMKIYFCNDLGEVISEYITRELLPDAFTLRSDDV